MVEPEDSDDDLRALTVPAAPVPPPGATGVVRRTGGDISGAGTIRQGRDGSLGTLPAVRFRSHLFRLRLRGRRDAAGRGPVTQEPQVVDTRTRRSDVVEELGPQVRVLDGVVLFDESERGIVGVGRAGFHAGPQGPGECVPGGTEMAHVQKGGKAEQDESPFARRKGLIGWMGRREEDVNRTWKKPSV